MDDITVKDRKTELQEGEQGMSRPDESWLIDVDVYLEEASDPPKFHLETCLPMDDEDVISFHNRGRPGFRIRFNLFDETAEGGYLFPPPNKKDEALWSKVGEGCPPDNYNDQWREFTVVRVGQPDRTTLLVRNLNETETKFGYTLRVTRDDGDTYVNLDPGGDNQNGSVNARFVIE
jgi:hypothetical protein